MPCPPSGAEIGHRILSENIIYFVQALTCSVVKVNVNICLFTDFMQSKIIYIGNCQGLALAKKYTGI